MNHPLSFSRVLGDITCFRFSQLHRRRHLAIGQTISHHSRIFIQFSRLNPKSHLAAHIFIIGSHSHRQSQNVCEISLRRLLTHVYAQPFTSALFQKSASLYIHPMPTFLWRVIIAFPDKPGKELWRYGGVEFWAGGKMFAEQSCASGSLEEHVERFAYDSLLLHWAVSDEKHATFFD